MKRKKLTTLLGGVGGPGGGGGGGGGNTGSLVQTMGAFTISATGTEVEDGQLVQTMGPFTISATGTVVSPSFDPATLPLSFWVQGGNYDATTGAWAASASAGISGTVPLRQKPGKVKPTDGVTLNGHKTVRFNSTAGAGSGMGLDANPFTLGALLSDGADFKNWTLSCLINFSARPSTSQIIPGAPVLYSSAGTAYWGFVVGDAANGFNIFEFAIAPTPGYQDASGGGTVRAGAPISTGFWYKVQARYTDDGVTTKLECRVNGGPWLTLSPCGNLNTAAFSQVFVVADGTINGDLADAIAANVALADADLDNIDTYYTSQYGV